VLTGGSGALTVSHVYITPHLHKCPAIRSQARSVAGHRFAPFGFCKQALCKVSALGGTAWPQKTVGPLPHSFFCGQAAPRGVRASQFSQALRASFCSAGFARVLAVGPRPPRGSFASLTSPAPWPVRPPRGLPPGRGCPAGAERQWSTAGPPRPSGASARSPRCSGWRPCK
jgi:hypothetical protein